VIRGEYRRTADFRASATDSDASLMPGRGGGLDLLYHDHYVVDGGKARIILAPLVTPAEVTENLPMPDLLWRVCFRWKLWPRQVTGDTAYGTTEVIVAVEDAGIRAFFPLPDFNRRTPFFGDGDFTYDAEADAYRCPEGQTLLVRKHKHTERKRVYQAPATACNACPLKARCTRSAKGRQLTRSFDEAYLDRVRGYHATEPYRKAMRKRKVWVEPLFAEAKEWHGLRRLRLRGLENANVQGLMIPPVRTSSASWRRPAGGGATLRAAVSWPSERRHGGCPLATVDNRPDRKRADPIGRIQPRPHQWRSEAFFNGLARYRNRRT
jgi:hypothetical protein